jgi:hypothetical protein
MNSMMISMCWKTIRKEADQIQCVVSETDGKQCRFGQTQHPELWNYADNVDTISFFNNIVEICLII